VVVKAAALNYRDRLNGNILMLKLQPETTIVQLRPGLPLYSTCSPTVPICVCFHDGIKVIGLLTSKATYIQHLLCYQ